MKHQLKLFFGLIAATCVQLALADVAQPPRIRGVTAKDGATAEISVKESRGAEAGEPAESGIALADAFWDCTIVDANPLTKRLYKTVLYEESRADFSKDFKEVAINLEVVSQDDGLAKATVGLTKEAPRVSGLPPVRLSTLTCPEGCGTSVFTLSFGKLTEDEQKDLKNWVMTSNATVLVGKPQAIRVRYHLNSQEESEIICDVSDFNVRGGSMLPISLVNP